jgi:hypothetical protein
VFDLVDDVPGLVYVGRLDFLTEGLLLLTTDGRAAHALTHPEPRGGAHLCRRRPGRRTQCGARRSPWHCTRRWPRASRGRARRAARRAPMGLRDHTGRRSHPRGATTVRRTRADGRAAGADWCRAVLREVARRIVGQEYMVERLLISLLTGGHVLLEGVPGLAKTLTVRTLAETVRTSFQRIQFTPDLLPADVIGTQIFDQATGEFSRQARADLREHHPRRRDQSCAGQGAGRAARGDAGEAGHDRRHDLPARRALPRARHAEPDRAGGHVPAARSAGRPLHAEAARGYPTRAEEKEILRRMAGGVAIAVAPWPRRGICSRRVARSPSCTWMSARRLHRRTRARHAHPGGESGSRTSRRSSSSAPRRAPPLRSGRRARARVSCAGALRHAR